MNRKSGLVIFTTLILVTVFTLLYTGVFDKKNNGLSLSEIKALQAEETDKKIIDTEGTNLPEIIIDETKEIPEPESKPEQKDDIEEDNQELIEELEKIQDNLGNIKEQEAIQEIANTLPSQINLAIPFYAQAPDGNRDLPWKEACEEASLVLAAAYMQESELSKSQFKKSVLEIVELEKEMFNDYIDTDMQQTAEVFERYFGFGTTKIIENPTIDQLKAELAQGHPIIAPFAGKELGNSNFTGGGPRYHVLVVRGYDDTYFYTNDVGTKRGKNFPYTYEIFMGALHDLVRVGEGEMSEGEKRVLVLSND